VLPPRSLRWLKPFLAPFRGSHRRRLRLVLKVALAVLALVMLKLLVHGLGLEFISLNPLFSALVAATVFLQGFLLHGVLSDFKESEKLPAQLAGVLESLALEIAAVPQHNPDADMRGEVAAVLRLAYGIHTWLLGGLATPRLMALHREVHGSAVRAAVLVTSSTLQGRLMGHMGDVLLIVNRIEAIRQTSFVPLVYWLASIGSALLCGGLIITRAAALHEAVFFLAVIAFNLIFLLRLILDIDNPFSFADPNSTEFVSLRVLRDACRRIQTLYQSLPSRHQDGLRSPCSERPAVTSLPWSP